MLVLLGTVAAVLGPTLPGLARNTGVGLNAISIVFTARSFGALLGSFFIGRLFDRVNGHRLMAAVLVGLALAMIAIPTSGVLAVAIVASLVLGSAEGTLHVGANTLMIWRLGERSGSWLNALHFCFGIGALIAPLVIGWTMGIAGGIRWGYWTLALPVPVVAAWLLTRPSPPIERGQATDIGEPRDRLLLPLIAAFFVLYVGGETAFGGWIYTYAAAGGGMTTTAAAYLTSAFWGMVTVGRLLAIPMARRHAPKTIVTADLMLCATSLALMLATGGTSSTVWIGSLGTGLGMASIFPTMLALAQRRMAITGRITSWFLVGASIGGMSVPWLIGQVFTTDGRWVVMAIILSVVVLQAVLLAIVIARTTPNAAAAESG